MNTALRRRQSDRGFALMEALAIMIIVGLLAGIAIPLYVDQQKKGHDAATKSDVNSVASAIAAYLENHNTLPVLTVDGRTVTVDSQVFAELSSGVVLGPIVGTNADNWCISATQPDGDRAKVKGYKFTSTEDKVEEGRCT